MPEQLRTRRRGGEKGTGRARNRAEIKARPGFGAWSCSEGGNGNGDGAAGVKRRKRFKDVVKRVHGEGHGEYLWFRAREGGDCFVY